MNKTSKVISKVQTEIEKPIVNSMADDERILAEGTSWSAIVERFRHTYDYKSEQF